MNALEQYEQFERANNERKRNKRYFMDHWQFPETEADTVAWAMQAGDQEGIYKAIQAGFAAARSAQEKDKERKKRMENMGVVTSAEFRKMGLRERQQLFERNPEEYKRLAELEKPAVSSNVWR